MVQMNHAGTAAEAPSLSALFLIRFDKRIGYTIAWQRSQPGLDLDGIVEYKSLPSGLHNLRHDLVYFIHGEYAGLSSFRSAPAGQDDRGASFAAVGCLVQKNGSRLGQVWWHAALLERLSFDAVDTSADNEDRLIRNLEQAWDFHKTQGLGLESNGIMIEESPAKQKQRKRALSESTTLVNAAPSTLDHPIHSLEPLVDNFGPLLFPLYRAALLRRRILLMSKPPLRELCNFVYALSIISSIPDQAIQEIESSRYRTSRPLFTVGVHDIPMLREIPAPAPGPIKSETLEQEIDDEEGGYVACSSDDILKSKIELFDLSVSMAEGSRPSGTWPILHTSGGENVQATHRDLRRYKELHRAIANTSRQQSMAEQDENDDDQAPLLRRSSDEENAVEDDDRELGLCVEAAPWAAVAYDSFVWWASAGEQRIDLQEEVEQDRQMFDAAVSVGSSSRRLSISQAQRKISSVQVALVGYFHKLTASIFHVITDLLDDKAEAPVADGGDILTISKADLARMGLDIWSKADRKFVQDLVALYFGIEAHIHGAAIECCGVRLI